MTNREFGKIKFFQGTLPLEEQLKVALFADKISECWVKIENHAGKTGLVSALEKYTKEYDNVYVVKQFDKFGRPISGMRGWYHIYAYDFEKEA